MNTIEKVSSRIGDMRRSVSEAVRSFAPSKTTGIKSQNPDDFSLINVMGGGYAGTAPMTYSGINDYLKKSQKDTWRVAYDYLDPFSCYVLALSNDRIMSAITAIARPIASAEFVAAPRDPTKPNKIEMQILNQLFEDPNPSMATGYDYNLDTATNNDQSSSMFQYACTLDMLCTGNNYIEQAYNQFGKPVALYRHPPYMIDIKNGYYVHKNGYIFQREELIHNKYFNPFSNKIGMSPLVPIVGALMLDNAILDKNIKNFGNDALKGILTLDKDIGPEAAQSEITRIRKQIREMRERGEEGHLVTFAAAFQTISASNKDMMTPEIEKSILNRVIANYGVPPAEIMQIDSGNLGSGTGTSQKETLYETVRFWNKFSLLDSYKSHLTKYGGITDTSVDVKNLTLVDERKQMEINREYILAGVKDIDQVRISLGDTPYDEDWSRQPTIPSNRIPLSMIGKQAFMIPKNNTPSKPTAQPQNS